MGGPDKVRIGPGIFDVVNALDVTGNEVTIVGSGTGRTKLIANSGSYGLQISEADSKVRNLRIHIEATGSTYRGLKLQGDASQIKVTAVGDSEAAGISMEGAAAETVELTDSEVRMPVDTDAVGVFAVGSSDREITGCHVKAAVSAEINATDGGSEIEQSVLTGTIGVQEDKGGVEIDDALIRVRPAQLGHAEAGLSAIGVGGTSAIIANHVTQLGAEPTGPADTGTRGVLVSNTGTLSMRNSILFGNEVDVQNNSGAATLDHTRWKTSAGSAVGDTNGTDANPRFTDNRRLRPSSPLIDRGQPFGLVPGEPPLDLAGNDRITNGDGRDGPRRDLGAYELQP